VDGPRTIDGLPPGDHLVVWERGGHLPDAEQGVEVIAGETVTVDFDADAP
jgi:hypothetical protein